MAHTREHKEQIQTAPSFVDQLVRAFTDAPERFSKLQEQPGLFTQKPQRTVAGIPQSIGDPGRVANTVLNADEAFAGNTVSDLLGALISAPSMINPSGGGNEMLERVVRGLGNFAGIEDLAPGAGAVGGVIKTNMRLREFLKLQKSRKAVEGPIGRRVTTIGQKMKQTINIKKEGMSDRLGGFTRTVNKQGRPSESFFGDVALQNPAHFDFDVVLNAFDARRGGNPGMPPTQKAIGAVQLHEKFHAISAPLVQDYFNSKPLLDELENSIKALPLTIQKLINKAPGGKAGRISEAFSRIMDAGNVASSLVETGELISRTDRRILKAATELTDKAAKAQGVGISKIKVEGLERRSTPEQLERSHAIDRILPDPSTSSVGNEAKVKTILVQMDEKDRFIKETNKAVDKFLRKSAVPSRVLTEPEEFIRLSNKLASQRKGGPAVATGLIKMFSAQATEELPALTANVGMAARKIAHRNLVMKKLKEAVGE